ncbi:hypothetical protein GCM10027091_32210 [Streptomyces daliensis]
MSTQGVTPPARKAKPKADSHTREAFVRSWLDDIRRPPPDLVNRLRDLLPPPVTSRDDHRQETNRNQ